MKTLNRTALLAVIALALAAPTTAWAFPSPVGTAVTYQGQLKQGGSNANGTFDLQFSLWDALAGPAQVGATICLDNVVVTDGIFTVPLDFGAGMYGTQARWLEIGVRADNTAGNCGAGVYTTLAPRQQLRPAPVALFAMGADGPNLTGLNASNLASGTVPSAVVSGVYSNAVSFTNAANTFTGSGALLNALNATNISAGIIANARTTGTSANTPNTLVLRDGAGGFAAGAITGTFTGSGASLTGVNADLLDSLDSLAFGRLALGQTWTGANIFSSAANSFTGNGAGLTALNASNITTGILNTARLPTGGDWNLTSILTIDTQTVAIDPTTNMVGIGIAAPTSPLHLYRADAGGTPFLRIHNVSDASSAVSLTTGFETWIVGQNRPPDAASAFDDFFVYNTDDALTHLMIANGTGNVGLGTTAPTDRLHVFGDARISQQLEFDIQAAPMIFAQHNNVVDKRMWISHSESFPTWGIQYRDIASDGFTADRIELTAGSQTLPRFAFDLPGSDFTIYNSAGTEQAILETHSGGAWLRTWDELGTTTSYIGSSASAGGFINLYQADGDFGMVVDGDAGTNAGGVVRVYNALGVATITLDGDFTGDGRVITQELQITGGSDLSEQFDVNVETDGGPQLQPAPGMIVCIDPKNVGELLISGRAYDRTVAGVISGAGGVKPGMLMGQAGTKADGKHPVALTGRVYCWCDASASGGGSIQPGDLLTTSDTPGHAMKVTDHGRANGAIIGKAMSWLEDGKGLVLVLVSLQ